MQNSLFKLFELAIDWVNRLVYVVISIALLGFLWGVVRTLFNSSKPEARSEGRKFMLYGIVTLFVMTSVWSIVYLFKGFIPTNTTTIEQTGAYNAPLRATYVDPDELDTY